MSYIWRTMEDDRVRLEHAARNGLVFDDNYRPEPGEEYNCRCIREATEEVDDEDQAAPPDPFGTFGKTFATSFGVSVAKEFYNAQLAPKLGLSKSTGGGRIGVLFTGINFFTQAGTTSEKLGSAALSLGTTLGLSKLETMLPGYAKLIIPAFVIGQGLLTGESVGEITGKVVGSILGSKFGGGVGAQLFGSQSVAPIVTPQAKINLVEGPKLKEGMFGLPIRAEVGKEAEFTKKSIKTLRQNLKSVRSRVANVTMKRTSQLAEILRNKGKVF